MVEQERTQAETERMRTNLKPKLTQLYQMEGSTIRHHRLLALTRICTFAYYQKSNIFFIITDCLGKQPREGFDLKPLSRDELSAVTQTRN